MASNVELQQLGIELAQARVDGTLVSRDLDSEIADMAQAQIVRAAAMAAYPSKPIGYKIGATSPQAQKMLGCDGPFYAAIFDRDRIAPDSQFALRQGLIGAECEFAFRMGEDYPANGAPVDRDTIAAAVASCHPALEIVGRRSPGAALPSPISCTADFGINTAFIPGAAFPDWNSVDLAAAEVRGLVNGEMTHEGVGENAMGHPLNALTWLAEALGETGERLKAGDWVSSGTCLGVIPISPGATITGDFGALGRVSVTIS